MPLPSPRRPAPTRRAPFLRRLPWLLLALWALGCGDEGCDGDDDDTTPADDDAGDDDSAAAGDPVVTVAQPEAGDAYDECGEICYSALLERDGAPLVGQEASIEVEGVGVLYEGQTDEEGRVTHCEIGTPAGAHEAAFTFRVDGDKHRGFVEFEVHPFGHALGLIKPLTPLVDLPWVPDVEKDPLNPVLGTGEDGTWDAAGVLLPSVVEHEGTYYLYYAGTETGDYEIGVATSADGSTWTRAPENPIVPLTGEPGSWKRYATNGPAVVVDGGLFRMWYAGRAEATSHIAIGYAESDDGIVFDDAPENPVLQTTPSTEAVEGQSIAHPTVVLRDGFVELWYSTAHHDVAYALSTDGVNFTRYCLNPVFEGAGSSWEMGQAKSAEVWFDGDLYWMTYAGGVSGQFQVGWAASRDGLRWVRLDQPLIAPGEPGTWEGTSTLAATLLPEGGDVRIWYAGTSADGGQIGHATAEGPP